MFSFSNSVWNQPDADYVVGETVKTKYMERWEEDPDFVTVIGSNNT